MAENDTVACLTTKEIKALAKPEFAANPEKFYPTETFKKLGFHRAQCPKCGGNYWRASEKRDTCGDSNCEGKYSFIGNGVGKGEKITFAEAWKGFEDSFTTQAVPCESIKRYPVVARWRNDVEFVAAGIYCFQPYCVTGELDPPANPLICPQFAVRFNDLDNIGLTGRHYSGFIMMGNQVFNYPGDYKYFKNESIEFNFRWLTETLKIDPEEITFVEDVWAGGGNLGPSIEYFIRGLEVGNMVFMQYKTFHDGSREELDIKVIDTGIGLERIAWLINGSATSYIDTFANALGYLQEATGVDIKQDIWEKFGPYSCTLNIDEVENLDKTWADISEKIDMPAEDVRAAIEITRDLYIVLDHTRTILIVISDGSLPSNVGGGGNVRNILRRCFSIMKKNGWWDKLGMQGFLEIFEQHKKDLEGIYGKFPEYKSFAQIIQVEYDRWITTDDAQTVQLKKLVQKKKGKLDIDDWIVAMQSWGIPLETIAKTANQPIPGNLYNEIAIRQERVAKAPETILYNTAHLPETVNMYYADHTQMTFNAKVVEVFANVMQQNKRNLLILNQSCFYPTSGGQMHDTGHFEIEGVEGSFKCIDVLKVGKAVLHVLDKELPEEDIKGKDVKGIVDAERRAQLAAHHTGTHVMYASCREVLGPHVWQAGAKKTTDQAHLDITHYKSLTKDEEKAIENNANRVINQCHKITKGFMDKAEAEKEYGFHLYQGGVVPGNSLRVVNIEGIDTEACCGTHLDSTAEVGWIRLIKSQRISDGIVRLYYVAQERAIQVMNNEFAILDSLCDTWGVDQSQIEQTASRFFNEYKRLNAQTKKQDQQILSLQVKYLLKADDKSFFVRSEQDNPTIYVSFLPQFAEDFQKGGKGIAFVGSNFVVGLFGTTDALKFEELEKICKDQSTKPIKVMKKDNVSFKFKEKGKKPINVKGVLQFMISGADFNVEKIAEWCSVEGLKEMD